MTIIEVIGQGSFGCVVKPPMQLIEKDKEYLNDNYVGKIFLDINEFLKEREILEKIKIIDKENNFTIPYISWSRGISNNGLCKNRYMNQMVYQLILGDGGKDLVKNNCKITYEEFLNIFKIFLEGIKTIGDKNYIHQDIKPDNVLLYCGDTKKLNLIDFSLYMKTEDIYMPTNELISRMYLYQPPEYFIYYIIIKNALFNFLTNKPYDKVKFIIDLEKLIKDLKDKNSRYYKLYKVKYVEYIKEYIYDDDTEKYFFNNLIIFIERIILKIEENEKVKLNMINPYENINAFSYYLSAYIFTHDIALKSDIFPLTHIIVKLCRNIVDKESINIGFILNIYNKCINSNPYERATSKELIELIGGEIKRVKPFTGGKKKSNKNIKNPKKGGRTAVDMRSNTDILDFPKVEATKTQVIHNDVIDGYGNSQKSIDLFRKALNKDIIYPEINIKELPDLFLLNDEELEDHLKSVKIQYGTNEEQIGGKKKPTTHKKPPKKAVKKPKTPPKK